MRPCDQVAVSADGVPIHYEIHGSVSPHSSSCMGGAATGVAGTARSSRLRCVVPS
jgi:hypothetical protein